MGLSARRTSLCGISCCFAIIAYICILGLALGTGLRWKNGKATENANVLVWMFRKPDFPYNVQYDTLTPRSDTKASFNFFGLFYFSGYIDNSGVEGDLCNNQTYKATPAGACYKYQCVNYTESNRTRGLFQAQWLCGTDTFLKQPPNCNYSSVSSDVTACKVLFIVAIVLILIGHMLVSCIMCMSSWGNLGTRIAWGILSIITVVIFVAGAIIASVALDRAITWAKDPCKNGNTIPDLWGEAYYCAIVGVVAAWILVIILICIIALSFPVSTVKEPKVSKNDYFQEY